MLGENLCLLLLTRGTCSLQQSSISLSSFVASDSGLDSSSTNYYPMMTPNPPGPSTIPSPSQEPCKDHSCKVPLLHSATYLQLVRIGLQLALASGVTYRPIMNRSFLSLWFNFSIPMPSRCPCGSKCPSADTLLNLSSSAVGTSLFCSWRN
jgi:hypothetical protein